MLQVRATTNGSIKTANEATKGRVSPELVNEILKALHNVQGWGSIEIFVQDFSVTQITVRNIKKTKHVLAE